MKLMVSVAAIGFGAYVFAQALSSNGSAISPIKAIASPCAVTYESFKSLYNDMSYESAVRIIGCEGREMSRSDISGYSTIMYAWDGSGMMGANMNAMFQNGRLVNKAQFGIR